MEIGKISRWSEKVRGLKIELIEIDQNNWLMFNQRHLLMPSSIWKKENSPRNKSPLFFFIENLPLKLIYSIESVWKVNWFKRFSTAILTCRLKISYLSHWKTSSHSIIGHHQPLKIPSSSRDFSFQSLTTWFMVGRKNIWPEISIIYKFQGFFRRFFNNFHDSPIDFIEDFQIPNKIFLVFHKIPNLLRRFSKFFIILLEKWTKICENN